MTQPILDFQGEHRWLSNFWKTRVKYEDRTYMSAEHAYQAAKTLDSAWRFTINYAGTPGEAKKLARTKEFPIQDNWNSIRLKVMKDIITIKFESNEVLRNLLLATGNTEIQEGNTWGDTFWGMVDGKGQNHLGLILMEVRDELRKTRDKTAHTKEKRKTRSPKLSGD